MADLRPLTPELQKVAIEELNEVPERLAADIQCLRDWINQQPHLRARTSDQFLVAFLRGCKFSLEKTKQKIDKYYTLKAALPEVFTNRDPADPKVLELIRLGFSLQLPQPLNGPAGPRITIFRGGLNDPDKFTITDLMKVRFMIADIEFLEDDNSVVSGVVEVMDMKLATIAHFLQLSPSLMKKASVFVEEALPIRQKGSHFINAPAGFETFFNTIKAILPEKAKKRLNVHASDMESFYKVVPAINLPKEYGGEGMPANDIIDYWEKKILSYRDYFLEEDQYGTDEHLRVGGQFNFESVFGVDGSFRKLEVD